MNQLRECGCRLTDAKISWLFTLLYRGFVSQSWTFQWAFPLNILNMFYWRLVGMGTEVSGDPGRNGKTTSQASRCELGWGRSVAGGSKSGSPAVGEVRLSDDGGMFSTNVCRKAALPCFFSLICYWKANHIHGILKTKCSKADNA